MSVIAKLLYAASACSGGDLLPPMINSVWQPLLDAVYDKAFVLPTLLIFLILQTVLMITYSNKSFLNPNHVLAPLLPDKTESQYSLRSMIDNSSLPKLTKLLMY